MKKVFVYISIAMMVTMVVFISVLCFVKKNVPIDYVSPYQVNVFNHSISSTILKEKDKNYSKVLSGVNDITNVSIFNRLIHGGDLNEKIYIDMDEKYTKYNSDIKKDNIAIEMIFDKEQDTVVWYNGSSRVISYFSLIYIIPDFKNPSEVIVYYSTSNGDTREKLYSECNPMIIYGSTRNFVNFAKNIIAAS